MTLCCKCKKEYSIQSLCAMTPDVDNYKKTLKEELYCCNSCKKLWDKQYLPLMNKKKWLSESIDGSYDEYSRVFFELFLERKFKTAFVFR